MAALGDNPGLVLAELVAGALQMARHLSAHVRLGGDGATRISTTK